MCLNKLIDNIHSCLFKFKSIYTKISLIEEFMKIRLLFNQPKNDQSSIIPQLKLDQLRIRPNVLLITKVDYLFKGWYYSGFLC